MNAKELQQFTKAIQESTEAFKEAVETLRRERSPWANPEDAADLLGIPRTKGKFHRRRLARLVDRGILKKVRAGKTPYYWKDELRAVALKVAEGDICV